MGARKAKKPAKSPHTDVNSFLMAGARNLKSPEGKSSTKQSFPTTKRGFPATPSQVANKRTKLEKAGADVNAVASSTASAGINGSFSSSNILASDFLAATSSASNVAPVADIGDASRVQSNIVAILKEMGQNEKANSEHFKVLVPP
jgi:hypothetical protein